MPAVGSQPADMVGEIVGRFLIVTRVGRWLLWRLSDSRRRAAMRSLSGTRPSRDCWAPWVLRSTLDSDDVET